MAFYSYTLWSFYKCWAERFYHENGLLFFGSVNEDGARLSVASGSCRLWVTRLIWKSLHDDGTHHHHPPPARTSLGWEQKEASASCSLQSIPGFCCGVQIHPEWHDCLEWNVFLVVKYVSETEKGFNPSLYILLYIYVRACVRQINSCVGANDQQEQGG